MSVITGHYTALWALDYEQNVIYDSGKRQTCKKIPSRDIFHFLKTYNLVTFGGVDEVFFKIIRTWPTRMR